MSPSRGTAVAIALLTAALATAGCGLGAGETVGEASLTVTRDYGAEPVLAPSTEEVVESDTAMRLLDREAEVETRYSGDFVEAIEGLEAEREGGRSWDWLFYVNGIEASVGAADYELRGGERIWWDYRDWSAALRVPAVVGSWPQPFRDGYEGRRRPTAVVCLGGAGRRAVRWKAGCGGREPRSSPPRPRGRSGCWSGPGRGSGGTRPRRSSRTARRKAASSPISSRGAGGTALVGLDEGGGEARAFGPDAGLVAATRRFGAPPVWIVSGTSGSGGQAPRSSPSGSRRCATATR